MAKWKISTADEKAREAAFEARVMAELAREQPQPPPLVPPRLADGIQISVTTNGHTVRYENLAAVPHPLRQQILAAWGPAPPPTAARSRSRRAAIIMNLFLPGAGQFYRGQPGWGTFYAVSFLAGFVPMAGILFRATQLAMSGDILEAGRLEKIGEILQPGILGALGTLQLIIITASIVHLFRSRSTT